MSTLKDVAKEAGVSVATVSRYVNNRNSVKTSNGKRIQRSIEKLRYHPNLIARSLRLRSTKTIAIVFADIKDPFYNYIAIEAEQTARDNGFSVILCNTEYDPERELQYIELMINRNVDGYLILTSVADSSRLSTMLINEKVVFIDQSSTFPDEVFVKLNNKEGVRLGIEYLVNKGHRDIGVINLTPFSTTGIERYEGYKEALHLYNVPYRPDYVKFCSTPDWKRNSLKATEELLHLTHPPTALFPMNGASTIGALLAIQRNGLKIPDDISVVGFDDLYFSELLSPALTTITQPVEKFGNTGMQLLIDMIEEKLPHKKNTIELQPQLIERNSCTAIRNAH